MTDIEKMNVVREYLGLRNIEHVFIEAYRWYSGSNDLNCPQPNEDKLAEEVYTKWIGRGNRHVKHHKTQHTKQHTDHLTPVIVNRYLEFVIYYKDKKIMSASLENTKKLLGLESQREVFREAYNHGFIGDVHRSNEKLSDKIYDRWLRLGERLPLVVVFFCNYVVENVPPKG